MASRTQIRQQQLTGSTVDIKARLNNSAAVNNAQPNTAALLTGSSQLDIFGYVGAALHRIHGAAGTEPFNNAVSTLSDGTTARISYVDGFATVINSEGGTAALTVGADGTPGDISVTAAGNLTVTADLAVNGNTTLGNGATDTLSVTGDATFNNAVEIKGNLKVTGDTTTTYITSSVVEFQDPMLVGNSADMLNNVAKKRKAGTSFLSASSDIESANGSVYDYGMIFKRSMGLSAANGINNGESTADQIPSLKGNVEGANERFSTSKLGSALGIFKTNGLDGGDLAANNASANKTVLLEAFNPRNGARNVDLLNAHKGAYVILSSSKKDGTQDKSRLGVIRSANGTNIRVDVLANTELYDGVGLGDGLSNAEMKNDATYEASIQLLNAYAGTIFDKEGFEFHHAAAALTGSGDNAFISGSANIMLYGAQSSARMSLYQNNLISGSVKIGEFDSVAEADESALMFTRLASQGGQDLMLKSAGDLILSASGGAGRVRMVTNDGSTIKFPAADGTVDQVMKTDGLGQLSFTGIGSLIPSLSRAAMRVKQGVTIAAGVDGLILTGANLAKDSVHFITASSGLTGGNGVKINELTDAEIFDRVSVFVNGQLLVSGSGTSAGVASDADYTLKRITSAPTGRISGSFAFDLEEDDTITLVVQAKS